MAAEMKRYLISFHATLQGHKMVLTAMKGMEQHVRKVTKTTTGAIKPTQGFNQALGRLAKREH